MVHLGAHAVFCPLHGPCPGDIRRRYGSEAHDGAADARRPDGSTIRDSAARARDSAALAGTWTSAARPADSAPERPDLWHDGCTARDVNGGSDARRPIEEWSAREGPADDHDR